MRTARPGDRDLDIDLDGVIVNAYTRLECEFIVHLSGGSGRWVGVEGETNIEKMTSMEVMFGFTMEPGYEWLLDELANRLDRWEQHNTPLRFVGAPGRPSLLMEDEQCSIPIPRTGQMGATWEDGLL